MYRNRHSFLAYLLTLIMVFNTAAQTVWSPIYAEGSTDPATLEMPLEEGNELLSLEVPPEPEVSGTTEAAIEEPADDELLVTASDSPPPPPGGGGDPPPPASYTISAPGYITVDEAFIVPLFPGGSTQYFSFTVTTTGAYTIIHDAATSGPVLSTKMGTVSGDPGVETFQELASDVDGSIGYNFETAGTFFLEVVNSGTDGAVVLQVNSPGSAPPEGPSLTAYTLGTTISAILTASNEEELYTFTVPSDGYYLAKILNYDTDGGYDFVNSLARISLGSYAAGVFTPYTSVGMWDGQSQIMEYLEADQQAVIRVSYDYDYNYVERLEPIFQVDGVTPPAAPTVNVPSGEVLLTDLTSEGAIVLTVSAEAGMEIYSLDPTDTWAEEVSHGVQPATVMIPVGGSGYVSRDFFAQDPDSGASSTALRCFYYLKTGTLSFTGNTAATSGTMTADDSLVYSFSATAGENYGLKLMLDGSRTLAVYIIDAVTGEACNLDDYGYPNWIGDNTESWQDTGFTAESSGTYLVYVQNAGYAGPFTLMLEKGVPATPEMSTTATLIGTGWMAYYEEVVPVTLATDTAGADIYYSVDYMNSEDPAPYQGYTGTFEVNSSADLRTYSSKDGVYSLLYYKSLHLANPDAPVFTPSAAVQPAGVTITVTAQPETTVYYTTDGSDPDDSTLTYFTVALNGSVSEGTNTFTLGEAGLDLKAITYKNGLPSDLTHVQYTAGIPVPLWTNQNQSGDYAAGYQPTLSGSDLGTIYYTLDGSDPLSSLTRQIYTTTGSITLQQNTRLRAVEESGGQHSQELSEFIRITGERILALDTPAEGLIRANVNESFTLPLTISGEYTIRVEGAGVSYVYAVGPDFWNYSWGSYYGDSILYEDLPYTFTADTYELDENDGYLDLTVYASSDATGDVPFTIEVATVDTPVIGHGQRGTTGWDVTLESNLDGASIYYAADGSDPTTSSTLYTGEVINIAENGTIKAIAVTGTGEGQVVSSVINITYPNYTLSLTALRYNSDGSGSYYTMYNGDLIDADEYYLRAYSFYSSLRIAEVRYYLDYSGNTVLLGTSPVTYPYGDFEITDVQWDTSTTPYNGSAVLRSVAYETSGSSQTYALSINMQTAPISAPTDLTISAVTTGTVDLYWAAPGDIPAEGTVYYDIFRGTTADTASMTKIGTTSYYIGYGAENPTEEYPYRAYFPSDDNDSFYYAVRAYVTEGRYGPFSNAVQADVAGKKDSQAPVINGLGEYYTGILVPENGYINEDTWYEILIDEDVALDTLAAELRPFDTSDGWESITGINGGDNSFRLSNDHAGELPDGQYVLRVNAADMAGNTASFTMTLWVDNTAPAVPVISNVEPMIGKIRLTFESASDDIHHYEVAASHSETRYDIPAQVSGGAVIYDFVPNSLTYTYDFQVFAYDRAGNRTGSAVTAVGYQALAYRPTMAVLPDSAKPGQVLAITVSGMMPGEWVALYIDDSGSAWDWEVADGAGTAVFSYAIPSNMVGAHRFKAEGDGSDARVIKTYVIAQYVPLVTVPAEADAGDPITVQAAEFGSVDPGNTGYVQVYLNGTRVYPDIAVTNATDTKLTVSGSETYQIPYTAAGELEVRAVRGDYTAISVVDVSPRAASLTVIPEGQSAGEPVSASVTGFAPGERVDFYKKDVYISNRYADGAGAAGVDIALAASDKGPVLFEARGVSSGLRRFVIYEASSALWALTGPASVYAGTSPKFTLSGLEQSEWITFYVNGEYYAQAYGSAGGLAERTIGLYDVGSMLITATGQTTGRTASMICVVQNAQGLDPSLVTLAESYGPGSAVTLNASGFKAYETIRFYWNNVQIAQVATGADGTVTAQYAIPAETAPETGYVFSAYGQTSGLLTSYGPAGAAHALGVALSGSPKPGEMLSADITGTYTADTCKVWLDGREIGGSGAFSGEGNTQFTYTLPYSTSVGSHNLLFITVSGARAEASLTVADPAPVVSVDPATHIITLSGFAPGEAIELKINGGTAIEDVNADGTGAYVYTPASLYGAGFYQVTALGGTSSFFAQTTFTVQATAASLAVTPEAALPGAQLTLSMSGYGAAETLRISLGGQFMKDTATQTDGTGALTDTLTIPVKISQGTYTISVTGLSSGKTAADTVQVSTLAPQVAVAAQSGDVIRANEYITIDLTGFPAGATASFY
ncbi:MAG TPA: hypothetical protein DF480_04445, partial [Clostridiales bacterium]|nr:hypothetical protein [Clostridiales bacterium]